MQEVIGLFPTPFMRVPGAFGRALVAGLVEHFSVAANQANNSSANLVHTAMLRPSDTLHFNPRLTDGYIQAVNCP